jgi:hypothetical protein
MRNVCSLVSSIDINAGGTSLQALQADRCAGLHRLTKNSDATPDGVGLTHTLKRLHFPFLIP